METGRILIIDDNDTDLLIAKIVIERAGFKGKLETMPSAKSAIEYLNSLKNNISEWPTLIFLDINMPLVSGYGFIEEFEKFDSNLKAVTNIVMLTSSDNKTDSESFLNKPYVKDFNSKPLSIENFKAIIEKLS